MHRRVWGYTRGPSGNPEDSSYLFDGHHPSWMDLPAQGPPMHHPNFQRPPPVSGNWRTSLPPRSRGIRCYNAICNCKFRSAVGRFRQFKIKLGWNFFRNNSCNDQYSSWPIDEYSSCIYTVYIYLLTTSLGLRCIASPHHPLPTLASRSQGLAPSAVTLCHHATWSLSNTLSRPHVIQKKGFLK